jgi:hypothetical protein
MVGLLRALGEPPVKRALRLLPQVGGHDGFVGSVVAVAVPFEIATVDAIAEDLVNGGGWHGAVAAPRQALRTHQSTQFLDRIAACGAQFEQAADHRCQGLVGDDYALPIRPIDILVTEWRERWPYSLVGFLRHALPGFLREVVDVVLGHQNLDAVDELL